VKLLLCDDDISTIDVIQSQLNCSEMGISKMLRAYNGEAAKEIIIQERPELILCDIGMPRCNGIDVLKFIHDNGIRTEFAFLTCYESFEYAQTAMRYGAVNYMTKPIDMDELNSVISKMAHASKARVTGGDQSENLIVNNTLINNMLRQIRDGHYGINRKRIDRALRKNQFGFTADSAWRLVYITADTAAAIDGGWEHELLTEGFQRLAEEMLAENIGTAYTVADIGEKFTNLTCFVPAEKCTGNVLLSRCRKFVELCMSTLSLNPVCLIGDEVVLYKTFEIAPSLHKRITRLRHQAGRTYLFREPENVSVDNYYFLDQDQILRCIRQDGKTDYIDCIAKALNRVVHIRDSNVNMLLRLHQELMQIFFGCLRDNGISAHSLLDQEFISELDTLAEWSLSDFMQFSRSMFDYVVSILHDVNDGENIIINAKQYIAEHFREDIDRNDVASVTYITPNYLSKKFRDEAGMNLREYINQLRIDEAKRLLLSTNMTVSEVSSEIGYDNSSYFSTVFRRICGVSPIKWREVADKEEVN
jgi:two-component system response regulator YesN